MVKVAIVGPGRVGGALALSLPRDKYDVTTIVVREADGAPAFLDKMPESTAISHIGDDGPLDAGLVFITTQDSSVAVAARAVALRIRSGTVVFHTSGAMDSSILAPIEDAGGVTGSFHPLVSISRPELGPERLSGAYICVEGSPSAVELGKKIAVDLGGRPFEIDTRFKTLYHAAAVTACGHLVALFDAAVEMMTKCGLDADQAQEILQPLVQSTVRNLDRQSPAEALTGTFARADIETFTRHLTTLNENVSDELLEIYLLLGERSLQLAAKQGVSTERIDTLRTKVAIAKSKLKW